MVVSDRYYEGVISIPWANKNVSSSLVLKKRIVRARITANCFHPRVFVPMIKKVPLTSNPAWEEYYTMIIERLLDEVG